MCICTCLCVLRLRTSMIFVICSNPQDFEVVRHKLTEKLKWYDETVEMIRSSRKMLNVRMYVCMYILMLLCMCMHTSLQRHLFISSTSIHM